MKKQCITATFIQKEERNKIFLDRFGLLATRAEVLMYAWVMRLAKSPIADAQWHYYTLSDDGIYVAPGFAERIAISVDNYYEGELSADAVGIVATLFALGQLAAEAAEKSCADPTASTFADMYHSVAAYATYHPEAAAIYQAID